MGEKKPWTHLFLVLFSQPYTLFARHFPCSSGLQHTTRGTPDCAFTACMIPPSVRSHCIHPALALRDAFPSVLSPLPAVSVPLPMSLPAADPCLLLQCVMPCKNHLHLFSLKLLLQAFTFHPTCSVAACCWLQVLAQCTEGLSGKGLGFLGLWSCLCRRCVRREPRAARSPFGCRLPPGPRTRSRSCLRHVKV